MPSTYTVNLGIEKPATGEQSGTWGDTVNDNSNILDEAINGAVEIVLAAAGSSGAPNQIAITDGSSSTGRNKWIQFGDSGDLGASVYVQLIPNDAEKICFIRNSLSGSRSIFLFQGTYDVSNDLEIAAGTDVIVKFNGGGAGATVVNVFANLKVEGLVATTADIDGGTIDGTVIGGAAAAALTATTVVANTSVNIAGDGATVTGIKDEDNMASDSATKLATQQSIKAYVDAQVATVDTLSEVLAIGNTSGGADINMDTAQKVQFRDAAIYINSSVDGQLDIVADTEIQIAATTIDIDGAINASGEIIAASLDISGNIDVDGITNLDVVDIDGTVQIDAAVTVGIDDTGYDVKFFGATGGKYMLWNQATDTLDVVGLVEFDSLSGTGAVAITDIKDEDDMVSDSATALSTQQSIKAYVDSQVATVDTLSEVLAIGNTSGGADINMDTEQKVQFRDAAIYINSSVDGQLDIVADTEIQIAATTIDINGAVNASGEIIAASLDVGGLVEFDSLSGTGAVAITDIKDEDDMVSDSATALSTQQSIKAYVDAQVGTDTLSEVLAAGNTSGGADINMDTEQKVQFRDAAIYINSSVDGQLDIVADTEIQIAATTIDINGAVNFSDDVTHAAGADIITASLGANNVRIGAGAGDSITVGGDSNVVVGTDAGASITTGSYNTAVGHNALDANTTGDYNTVSGGRAFRFNTTGSRNVAVGYNALDANTTANNNTAVGYSALNANTTGTDNVAMGHAALDANTTGASNVAVGYAALGANTTGGSNVALGYAALDANTTASNNVAMGQSALGANTTGASNVAVGYAALGANTTGANNVALGHAALDANTTANNNTAVGYAALGATTTGANNTALGRNALPANTTANNNVAVGYSALEVNTTGASNVAVGNIALDANTTGDYNVAIGYGAGYSTYEAAQLTTGTGNVFLGYRASCTVATQNYGTAIGYGVAGAAGYTTVGQSSSDIRAAHGVATWATVSDERYKKDIADSTAGLAFVNALRPRTFKYRTLGELPETFSAYESGSTKVFKNSDTNHGFIAQEVKAAIDADSSIKDGFRLWDDREDGSQEVAEAALIPVLTKAIQELSAQVTALTARLAILEG